MSEVDNPSRRALFMGPLNRARRVMERISDSRSRRYQDNPVDSFVEIGGELLGVGGIVQLAWKGTHDKVFSVEPRAESSLQDRKDFPKRIEIVLRFARILQPAASSVNDLHDAWYRNYYDCDYVCTGMGDDRSCSWDCDWEDPWTVARKGLDHRVIKSWQGEFNGALSKTAEVVGQAPWAFDISGGSGSVYYQTQVVDAKSQLPIAALAYLLPASVYPLYEEVGDSVAEEFLGFRLIDSEMHIKRRTVFKLGVLALAAPRVRRWQLGYVDKNRQLVSDVEAETKRVIGEVRRATPDETFQTVIGTTPLALQAMFGHMETTCNRVLAEEDDLSRWERSSWDNVRPHIEATGKQAHITKQELADFFRIDPTGQSSTIPQGMTDTLKSVRATDQIRGYAQTKRLEVNTRHLVDAIDATLLISQLVAAAGVGEIAFHLSDQILEWAEDQTRRLTKGESF